MTDREKLVKLLDDMRATCDVPENVDEDGCGTWNIEGGEYIADHLIAHGVTVRKTGRWIYHHDDLFPAESTQECPVCHEHEFITLCNDNYCPNCGAKLEA